MSDRRTFMKNITAVPALGGPISQALAAASSSQSAASPAAPSPQTQTSAAPTPTPSAASPCAPPPAAGAASSEDVERYSHLMMRTRLPASPRANPRTC